MDTRPHLPRTAPRVLALAIATLGLPSVHAQRIVLDPSNLAQAVQQVAQLQQQLLVMQQQYAQLMATYRAVAHAPSTGLQRMAGVLNNPTFRNALPAAVGTIGAAMDGTALGGTGPFAAAAAGHLARSRLYAPPGTDHQAVELRRHAQSIAGAQAAASELYRSATARVQALQGLEAELAAAPDAKAVADLQARLAAEQAYIQAQQVQAQSLAMWQQSQQRSEAQRDSERRREQVDLLIEQAKARGG